MTAPKVALVTGASSGIGRVTAELLSRRGYNAFGTSRDPSRARAPEGVEMVAMDVTSAESVASGVGTVLGRAGGIDVLVNNVGYVLLGAAEETSFEEFYAQLDTNFIGAVRVTSAVLPSMREQRKGKIVNVSSLGGLAALPYTSAYAASKFALEGYSESLRLELLPFGVYVSLLEPTNVRTETLDTSVRRSSSIHPAYAEIGGRVASGFKAAGLGSKFRPDAVAHAIARVAEHPAPRLRHPVGAQARFIPLLKSVLPSGLFEVMIRRQLRSAGMERRVEPTLKPALRTRHHDGEATGS